MVDKITFSKLFWALRACPAPTITTSALAYGLVKEQPGHVVNLTWVWQVPIMRNIAIKRDQGT